MMGVYGIAHKETPLNPPEFMLEVTWDDLEGAGRQKDEIIRGLEFSAPSTPLWEVDGARDEAL